MGLGLSIFYFEKDSNKLSVFNFEKMKRTSFTGFHFIYIYI